MYHKKHSDIVFCDTHIDRISIYFYFRLLFYAPPQLLNGLLKEKIIKKMYHKKHSDIVFCDTHIDRISIYFYFRLLFYAPPQLLNGLLKEPISIKFPSGSAIKQVLCPHGSVSGANMEIAPLLTAFSYSASTSSKVSTYNAISA